MPAKRSPAGRFSVAGWRDVALLGLVSLIAEISGEMTSALLPVLLVTQGATGLGIGLVDGITEGIGDFFKLVGGLLGRRTRHRRLLIGFGYLVASLSRFGVAAASSWPATLAARSVDRVGKGLRTAPRDAMLSEFVPASSRGKAFGLHLASDASGGVLAVLAVVLLTLVAQVSERQLVLAAAVIGMFAVVPLFWVREQALGGPPPLERASGGKEFVPFLVVACIFSFGSVSYMFFMVHAALRFGVVQALGLYLLFEVLESASAWWWGRLGDTWGKRRTLGLGYILTAAASAAILVPGPVWALAAFALLGLAMGCTEGVSRAFAAQVSGVKDPVLHLGEYHAATGFADLVGSITVGLLWDVASPAAAFGFGVVAPLAAVAGLAVLRWRFPHPWRKGLPILPS